MSLFPEAHLVLSYDTPMYQPPLRDVWLVLDQKRKMIHNSDVTSFLHEFNEIFETVSRITGKKIESLDDIKEADTEKNAAELFGYLSAMADIQEYGCSVFCAEQALRLSKKYKPLNEFTKTAEMILSEAKGEHFPHQTED